MDRYRPFLRQYILPACIVIMWCGMLWSRAILSMGMIAFVTSALASSGFTGAWLAFRQERATWGLALLFLIPLLTGIWSADKEVWAEVMQIKLPFLMLPFTLAGLRSIPPAGCRWAWQGLVAATLLAAVLVLWHYLGQAAAVNETYLRGAVMQVPMENDHVRFGWGLALVYAWLLDQVVNRQERSPYLGKKAAMAMLVFLGLFILLLSSRTGWLGLLLANGFVLWRLKERKRRAVFFSLLVVVPLVALFLMPSLLNRVRFMVWDFQNYSRGGYVKGLNDAPRIISWQAGADLLKQHPLAGTGFGDLRSIVNSWYADHRPDMPVEERLFPANEWILHGAASGIPGMFAFCVALVLVMARRSRWMVWKVAMTLSFLGFLYEIGLELQYGVFLFGFFTLFLMATDPLPDRE